MCTYMNVTDKVKRNFSRPCPFTSVSVILFKTADPSHILGSLAMSFASLKGGHLDLDNSQLMFSVSQLPTLWRKFLEILFQSLTSDICLLCVLAAVGFTRKCFTCLSKFAPFMCTCYTFYIVTITGIFAQPVTL